MAHLFVNPMPNALLTSYISFDFPCCGANDPPGSYTASLPNYNIHTPGIEQMYGPLGNPPKEQGHPRICEHPAPQPSDPGGQDQVLDITRQFVVEHTARLSGDGLNTFINPFYRSLVKMYAHPLTTLTTGDTAILLSSSLTEVPLPPQPRAVNVWFWHNGVGSGEMLHTAQAIINPSAANLIAEVTYKLIVKWEFWDYTLGTRHRMIMSGFDDEISFEVTSL